MIKLAGSTYSPSLSTRLLGATALCLCSAVGALADDGTSAGGLETIIVTAEKRSENIKDVPISISSLSAEQLAQHHVDDYTDLARTVPGLTFSNEGGSGLDQITLRGISSSTGSATVGIYLDDVSLSMPNMYSIGATEPKFFDISRVEVLRGPQGTLYGASSMGGTIRFISNQPDLDHYSGSLYAELSGTKGGDINYETQGVANIPLIPGKVALRVGIDETYDGGYIDHVSTSGVVDAKNVNGERFGVLRASLKIQPTDDLTITPAFLYQRSNVNDTSVLYTSLPEYEQSKLVREKGTDKLMVPSLTVDDNLHWADLTSVTSYFQREFRRTLDGTAYNSQYLAEILDSEYGTDNSAVANLPGPVHNTPGAGQWTEELRLASKSMAESNQPFTWLGGLFLADQHVKMTDEEFMPGLGSTLQQLYGESAEDVLGVPLTRDEVAQYLIKTRIRQAAAFGEVSYQPIDKLTLSAGLRYLVARTSLAVNESGYFTVGLPSDYTEANNGHALTPKFAATYAVSDSSTLYANAVKGFRLGSPNQPVPTGICGSDLASLGVSSAPIAYAPDSLWSYEAGTKTSLFGNRLTVNADAYYIDWKSVQQQITLPTCGFAFTANAGKARSYGGELEMKARLARGLTVAFSGSANDARLTSADSGTGATAGQELVGVPEWTATVATDYQHQLTDSMDGFVRADWDWIGPSHGSFSLTNPDYSRPSYALLNASLGANINTLEISLFVKNLLNQDKIIQHPAILFVSEGYTVRPLTIGVGLRAEF